MPNVLAISIAAAVGCGGPAHKYDAVVTGTVTIDGELAKSGTVIFYPVKQEGLPAIGRIYPDGSYSLRTGQGDLRESDGGTVESGEYIVAVAITAPPAKAAEVAEGGPPVPGPSLIAERYTQKGTSDLHRTVKPGPNVFVLELAAAEPTPPAEAVDAAAGKQGGATDSTAPSTPSAEITGPDGGQSQAPPATAPAKESPPPAAAPAEKLAEPPQPTEPKAENPAQ